MYIFTVFHFKHHTHSPTYTYIYLHTYISGGDAWAPGHDVAILSAGRLVITVICGKYWLMGYSLAYMVYGYALTDAIITKHLPHMSKVRTHTGNAYIYNHTYRSPSHILPKHKTQAEAGAIAFFGFDSFLRTNFDMASSPEFCFGFLSFGFLALLLACSYVKPAGKCANGMHTETNLWVVLDSEGALKARD